MENEQLTFEFAKRPTIKGFPELRWTGKRPYEFTQYYPAQIRERYGEEQNGWINKIFWGDNLQVMSHLLKEYRGQVDLIYIDPPFDSKADYKKKIEVKGIGKTETDTSSFEEKQYGDIWTNDEYLQFMYERAVILRELLSDRGSFYIHCDYHQSMFLRCIFDEVFGFDHMKNEIVWHYEKWTAPSGDSFQKNHDTIFMYSKNKNKFNTLKEVTKNLESKYKNGYLIGGGYGSNGLVVYDKTNPKVQELIASGKYQVHFADMTGKPISDVWEIPFINPQAHERTGYPTQKPEALLERIINASSNPGDLVFDCFMGSGTTQAVAMKLGRRFIGADINLGAIQTTTKRLISIAKELKPEKNPQLTLMNGGKKSVTYDVVEPTYSMVAESPAEYYTAASSEEISDSNIRSPHEIVDVKSHEDDVKYTGFEVYNVNNYDFFRNPVEARDLIIEALEIQPYPQSHVWDGELDGRMVKIMPVNRIATKADLEELKANLPYHTYEKRKEESPNQPVERMTIVCMGHEPDLKASLEQELSEYKLDVEIVDILRDKKELQLKREAEAEIVREGDKLVIRSFYPMNLLQKLSLQKEYVEDWRQLVESIMIDWNYDGVVMQPSVTDVPGKKELVKGIYDIPEDAGTIKVKITDLLSESLEMEVE